VNRTIHARQKLTNSGENSIDVFCTPCISICFVVTFILRFLEITLSSGPQGGELIRF